MDRPVGPLSTAGRSQPLLIALRGTWTTEGGKRAGTTGVGLYWNAACRKAHAHGSRHSVVECESPHGRDLADGVGLMAARHPTALERIPASATQGKVERFSRLLQRAQLPARACPTSNASSGWMSIATNINQVRPHEALEMQTPASRWRRSARAYNPHPAPLAIPGRRDGGEGSARRARSGRNAAAGNISYALAGQRVEMVRLQDRVLVYHCRTLIGNSTWPMGAPQP